MCAVPLPPGVYPIAVDKYIIIKNLPMKTKQGTHIPVHIIMKTGLGHWTPVSPADWGRQAVSQSLVLFAEKAIKLWVLQKPVKCCSSTVLFFYGSGHSDPCSSCELCIAIFCELSP